MAKNPSTRWYFNDWRNDTELMACSDAAQGLWAWLLCLCAEADGYLRIAGQAPSISQLAQLRGRDKRTISRQLKELERNGVFDRTEDGTIYNRRMVREAEARRINGAGKRCRGGAKVGQKFVKPLHPHRDPNQAELFDNSEKTRTRAGDSDSGTFGSSPDSPSNPKPVSSPSAAREGESEESEKGNPEGARCARLGGSSTAKPIAEIATGLCRGVAARPPPKTPALKAKIRDQLVQKHARFLAARKRPEEVAAYWAAMLSDDAAAAQRMLDDTDARMRRANWDDMRQWKAQHGIAA